MNIIGIDPGYAITGWAVLTQINNEVRALDYGVFDIPKKSFYERMREICSGVEKIIKKYNPLEAAIEKLYFNKNAKTAIDVAQIRGALACTLNNKNIKIFDYTPLQVKQAIAGYGRAEKSQEQNMVKILLGLKEIPRPDEAADALAVRL